eukprot:SAG22_NODE_1205_length_5171_cov_8.055205_3_plen_247_part_00
MCTAPDHNTAGFDTMQLASSRNLYNWTRVANRSTFIGPSRLDSGALDTCQIMPPSGAVVSDGGAGNTLFFFYTAGKHRWQWTKQFPPVPNYFPAGYTPTAGKETKTPQGVAWDAEDMGIVFATLRRDGFVSLDHLGAVEPGHGVVTSVAMVPPVYETGIEDLYVNVDCEPHNGTVEVVLYDANVSTGGCTANEIVASLPIRGDTPAGEVTWGHPAAVRQLANTSLCVQFLVTNCSLYSYWWGGGGR